ncbi:transcription antitermination protein [Buchnera aphidicola (Cinara tujafilina)]|uniref:Transcription antitermination protein NusB n=1 Tax=Buchnera aphidicola (Cinara tujafilina) TaxID=261317 RepID=F7WZK4_9GAMM|nr:transcription antitermination factor NusB [Buchnera aphidicola]AEH39871.1 transcription antitermination protein [Buchnera aphidicola (Cinara tujafilina)]
MIPKKRRQARILALQVLYAWQISKNNLITQIKKFILKKTRIFYIDEIYFHEIISGVIDNVIYLDKLISPVCQKIYKKLDCIEKNILRISSYEIFKRTDIPYKVTINEGIELAKIFGSCTSHKFINGVLDSILLIKKKKHKKN